MKLYQIYGAGLLDLEVNVLNLKRQVSLTNWLIPQPHITAKGQNAGAIY